MQENNRFIKKFENKNKHDLEQLIQNASLYEPSAVEAAKYLLKNKGFNNLESNSKIDEPKEEPQLIEKAFFKSSALYKMASLLSLGYSVILLFISFYQPSVYTILWAAKMSSCFLVIISKHKKTVLYLKLLGILALIVLSFQYAVYLIVTINAGGDIDFFALVFNDYKLILACVLMIFLGESLIETKLVPKEKTRHNNGYDQ
jgi:hypothetical protein